jgi:hypothetical protein
MAIYAYIIFRGTVYIEQGEIRKLSW